MKLFNIFKKETTKVSKANFQTLGKEQLEKVIGGGGSDVPLSTNGGPIRGVDVKIGKNPGAGFPAK